MKNKKDFELAFFKHFFTLATTVLLVVVMVFWSRGIVSERIFKIMDASLFFCSVFNVLLYFNYKERKREIKECKKMLAQLNKIEMTKGGRKMKIYIAGKITGLPRAEVERKFNSVAEKLKAEGHEVFVPTVLPFYPSVPHEDYMHVCYAIIDICEADMLSDWQKSVGARMEIQYAADWKKKIIYQDESTIEPNYPAIRRPS